MRSVLLISLVLTLAAAAAATAAELDGQHQTEMSGHHHDHQPDVAKPDDVIEPYMDETGRLCQDKIEMVEDVEYENQIHCKVQMQKSCQFINSPAASDEQACHTMYHKECQTIYRPHMTKVNVRVCPEGAVERIFPSENRKGKSEPDTSNSVVIDVRPSPPGMVQSSGCVNGRRKVCVTKYETECATEMVNHEMTEDHPKCRVEKVPKCDGDGTNCRDVSAMRCRIEQRTVVKSKPETKCHRVPREFCHKEDCKEGEEDSLANNNNSNGNNNGTDDENSLQPNCYFREQIVNEVVPEEKCKYRPERVCHPVLNGAASRTVRQLNDQLAGPAASRKRICEMVPTENCENKRMNPRRILKPMKKKICRFPRPNSSYDRRIMKKMNLDFPGNP